MCTINCTTADSVFGPVSLFQWAQWPCTECLQIVALDFRPCNGRHAMGKVEHDNLAQYTASQQIHGKLDQAEHLPSCSNMLLSTKPHSTPDHFRFHIPTGLSLFLPFSYFPYPHALTLVLIQENTAVGRWVGWGGGCGCGGAARCKIVRHMRIDKIWKIHKRFCIHYDVILNLCLFLESEWESTIRE